LKERSMDGWMDGWMGRHESSRASPTEWIDVDSFDVPFLGNGGRPSVTATSLPLLYFSKCFSSLTLTRRYRSLPPRSCAKIGNLKDDFFLSLDQKGFDLQTL